MCRRSLRGRRSQRPHSGYTDYGDYADYSGYQPRGTNTLVEEQERGYCQGGDYADYADYASGTRRHLSDYAADYDVATVSQVVGTSLCAASALPAICHVTRSAEWCVQNQCRHWDAVGGCRRTLSWHC